MQLPHLSLCLQDDQDSKICVIWARGRVCVTQNGVLCANTAMHSLSADAPVLRIGSACAVLLCSSLQMSQPARLVKKEVEDVRSDQDFSSASQCEGAPA